MSVGKVLARSFKNLFYAMPQIAVREATCNDESQPTMADLLHVADITYRGCSYPCAFRTFEGRLKGKAKDWRHIDKALFLLDFLIRYGSVKVIKWCSKNTQLLKKLTTYESVDSRGVDHGKKIRRKAHAIIELLTDLPLLEQERTKAQMEIAKRNEKMLKSTSRISENHRKSFQRTSLGLKRRSSRRTGLNLFVGSF